MMYTQVTIREDIAFVGSEQLAEIIRGLERYEMALQKAPYGSKLQLRKDQAREEIARVQELAERCKQANSRESDSSRVRVLRPVTAADGGLLEAARRVCLRQECRRLEREIQELESRKAEAGALAEQRRLAAEIEPLEMLLETNRRDEEELPTDVLSHLLLPPDQILDICDGVDTSDPSRDIL
jgi:hypothetical protein